MEKHWFTDLKKLRITRIQWRIIGKWSLYTIVLVATIVIQSVILSRLPIFGAKVNLIPYLIGCVCIIEGADSGSLFSLIASLIWALSGGDYGFVSILILTCGGMGLGLLFQKLLRCQLVTCLVCCFILALCHDTSIFLLRLYMKSVTAMQYFRILIPGTLLGIFSCPVFFYLFQLIHRIGGNHTWND